MSQERETIVAPATPPGKSSVALVRLSGPQAFSILAQLAKKKTKQLRSHQVFFSPLIDNQNKKIDEALCWAMRGPRTYTGEDVVEISAHGNPIVVYRIIEAAIQAGARLAEKGEFTKRAFLAGKLDLAQAEAVATLISSRSSEAAEQALLHLEGNLSKEIKKIRNELLASLAHTEATLDYPEETPEVSSKQFVKNIQKSIEHIKKLIQTNRQGQLLKDGVKVVIAGAPNVGKSSLLNALVGDTKAIVTNVPGTTRDAIEEIITIKGMPVRLIDTAGLRHGKNIVERLGIERTLAHVETADLVLFIVDASRGVDKVERAKIQELVYNKTPLVVVGNKSDLVKRKKLSKEIQISVSAKTSRNMERLKEKIVKKAGWRAARQDGAPIVVEARHKQKLIEAEAALIKVIQTISNRQPQDMATIDLKAAIIALGEITGDEVSDEVIDSIFENFCVGK